MKRTPTLEQKMIIGFENGCAMVNAGPGCAKTTTLALRARRLINNGIAPQDIVITTFSKSLTQEIRKTLIKLLDTDIANRISVRTFHSLALALVKDYLISQNPSTSKLMASSSPRLIRYYIKKSGMKEDELNTAFFHIESGNKKQVEIDLGKQQARKVLALYNKSSGYENHYTAKDFEAMISTAQALLTTKQGRDFVKTQFKHLMVDELQDIDKDQKDLILKLAKLMGSTVLVGDPNQLIYEWRKASPDFWEEIKAKLQPQLFYLTVTFRFSNHSLPLINDVNQKINKHNKKLTSMVNDRGEKPSLHEFHDLNAQYDWLAKEIKNLLAKGVDANQIAVLGTIRDYLSQTAIALNAKDIAVNELYRKDLIKTHIQHLWSLIQLTILEQKRSHRRSQQFTNKELSDAKTHVDNLWLPNSVKSQLKKRLNPGLTSKHLLQVSSNSRHYNLIHRFANALSKAATLQQVESAIQCLIDASKSVLKGNEKDLLLRDLSDIKIKCRQFLNLQDIEEACFATSQQNNESVTLSTVCSAKGREWQYVFLINVVDGVYPNYLNKNKQSNEDMRIFFVAISRHKIKLHILQAPVPKTIIRVGKKRTSIMLDKASPYIDIKKQKIIQHIH